MQTNGFNLLCEKLKKLSLNDIVDVLEDPSKPRKQETPKLRRLGLTIANTYIGNGMMKVTPGCKKSAEQIQDSMEYWDFKVISKLNRTKTQFFEDIEKFVNEVKEANCDDLFVYLTGHGGMEMSLLLNT